MSRIQSFVKSVIALVISGTVAGTIGIVGFFMAHTAIAAGQIAPFAIENFSTTFAVAGSKIIPVITIANETFSFGITPDIAVIGAVVIGGFAIFYLVFDNK